MDSVSDISSEEVPASSDPPLHGQLTDGSSPADAACTETTIRSLDPETFLRGLSVEEIENLAQGQRWLVVSRVEQIQEMPRQGDVTLEALQAILLIVPTSDLSLATTLLQALVVVELELPDVIVVLSNSLAVPANVVLLAQQQLLALGIDDVLPNRASAREMRTAIQMSLFKSQHKHGELAQAASLVRDRLNAQLEDRVRQEVSTYGAAQAASHSGLFWQAAHRTFEGFPRLDRSLPRQLDIGSKVGPCCIDGHLGAGAFGVAYSVTNVEEQRYEALKVISKDALDELHKIIGLWKEMCCHTKLEHTNIVKLLGTMHGVGYICLRMELAGTTSLFRALRLAGNRFSLDGAVAIFEQFVSAVAHCHERQIAHRDLKPENVVLANTGMTIKVCDFGSASPSTKMRCDLVGTMPFIAPEVLSADRRKGFWPAPTDIWATGVILLEMVCGVGKLNDMLGWHPRTAPSADCCHDLCMLFELCPTCIAEAPNAQLGSPFEELNEVLSETIKLNPAERWTASDLVHFDLAACYSELQEKRPGQTPQ